MSAELALRKEMALLQLAYLREEALLDTFELPEVDEFADYSDNGCDTPSNSDGSQDNGEDPETQSTQGDCLNGTDDENDEPLNQAAVAAEPAAYVKEEIPDDVKLFVAEKRLNFKKDRSTATVEKAGGKQARAKITLDVKAEVCLAYAATKDVEYCQQLFALRMKNRAHLQSEVQLKQWVASVSEHVQKCKELGKAEAMGSRGRKRGRSGRPIKYQVLDQQLIQWLKAERKELRIVSPVQVGVKCEELLPNIRLRWLQRFLKRHKMTLRRVQRRTLLSEEEMKKRAGDFHLFIAAWGDFDAIVNGDEIPDSVSGKMTSDKTYEVRGSKNVIGQSDANHFKRASTYLPLICMLADGGMKPIPPVIIHRATCKRLNSFESSALVLGTDTGVMTADLMIRNVIPHLATQIAGVGRTLVVLDSARSHITEEVIAAFKQRNLVPCVIPGGMTQFLQFVDTDWAAQYRRLRLKAYHTDAKPKTAMEQRDYIVRACTKAHDEMTNFFNTEQNTPLGGVWPLKAAFSKLGYISEHLDKASVSVIGYVCVARAAAVPLNLLPVTATKPIQKSLKEMFAGHKTITPQEAFARDKERQPAPAPATVPLLRSGPVGLFRAPRPTVIEALSAQMARQQVSEQSQREGRPHDPFL
jgi:hypothetical protein